jgi:hypothetical protein
MTVNSTANRWSYLGNGVTTAFAYTNLIFAASDLKVYLAGVPQTAGYTVSGVGVAGGGAVTFAAAPALGASVLIVRDVPATQDIDYVANDAFRAETHERGLDKLTVLIQQLKAALARTIRAPDLDAGDLAPLPAAALRANSFLAFDANGNPITSAAGGGGGGGGGTPISTFAQTLLDDIDAGAARATLGAAPAADTPSLSGGNTFSGANVFGGAVSLRGAATVEKLGAEQAELALLTQTPYAFPGRLIVYARDTANNTVALGGVAVQFLDATPGALSAQLQFFATKGTYQLRAAIGHGLMVGNALPADPGDGSVNITGVYYRNGAPLPFQRGFTSAPQAYANGGLVGVSHGLGGVPALFSVTALCVSPDLGYVAGHQLMLNDVVEVSGGGWGINLLADSSGVLWAIVATSGISVVRLDTRAVGTLNPAKWQLVFRAFA